MLKGTQHASNRRSNTSWPSAPKHQLRRMPNLEFFIDDSLDYIENIEKSMKGEENPIDQPDLLSRRKKS